MLLKFLLLGSFFTILNLNAQYSNLYVGTYTQGDSDGIYYYKFNTETGELTSKTLAITIDNPSFLTHSKDGNYLYSVNDTGNGFVSSYKINKDHTLNLLTRVSSHGKAPCHIAINGANSKIAVSNYWGGTVPIYAINKDGALLNATQVFNLNTDEIPARAHSAQFHLNDLFVADLGNNAITHFKLSNDDSYKLASKSIIEIKGNPGPRHFAVTKDDTYLYVINEYGSSITSIKKTKKGYKQIDHDSTLDTKYKGKNSCADIHLSKDEQFLYGSNRGENSIAVFKRNLKTGTLEKIQNISVHGNWPRNFTLDPSGKFLLVANRKSNAISVFKINTKTGMLTFLKSYDVPEPVCLDFI